MRTLKSDLAFLELGDSDISKEMLWNWFNIAKLIIFAGVLLLIERELKGRHSKSKVKYNTVGRPGHIQHMFQRPSGHTNWAVTFMRSEEKGRAMEQVFLSQNSSCWFHFAVTLMSKTSIWTVWGIQKEEITRKKPNNLNQNQLLI